ncbi:MAG TPA: murein biosynthesis integral membrane protein MurJ [Burkholderiales bacterium]
MNLLRSAATVSSFTLLSRITGLIRDLLIARLFGAAAETDAFAVAFRLPNLLRRIFAEGAFSQAFVPILAEARARDGADGTHSFLSHVASALFWVLLAVTVAGVIAAPALVWLIATGFASNQAQFELATAMTRWMFPYILFMSLVAFAAGVLNTFHRFAVPAFTPVLLNLSFIACALFIAPQLDQPVMALAFAVLLGGALQLALQLPALAGLGLIPRLVGARRALADPSVRRVLKKMGPAVFAVSVAQISLIINTNIASHLPTGSVAWLYFADRLMEFPTALLGVALGTVLLPGLSRASAEGRSADYNRLLEWGLRLSCLIALPAALGLGALAEPIIAVLYEGQRFSPRDTAQTALALIGYAVGLLGLITIKILAPGFYAKGDIRTPVRIAVGVLIATQLANLALVPWLAHAGLALSISLGALANAALLYVGLRRRGLYQPAPGWAGFFGRIAIALALLAVLLWLAHGRWEVVSAGSTFLERAVRLGLVIGAAIGVYGSALWALGFRVRDFSLRSP